MKTTGVRCWEANYVGELGDGNKALRLMPPDTDVLTGVLAIAAGGNFTCALMTTGGVRCWGLNDSGQLGDGSNKSRSTPPIEVFSSVPPPAQSFWEVFSSVSPPAKSSFEPFRGVFKEIGDHSKVATRSCPCLRRQLSLSSDLRDHGTTTRTTSPAARLPDTRCVSHWRNKSDGL